MGTIADFTDEEMAVVIRYAKQRAMYRIKHCSVGVVDRIARNSVQELTELGADDAAQEVYDYYVEIWGS